MQSLVLRSRHAGTKNFPWAKKEIYQRGREFEADFRHTNFFGPLTPHPSRVLPQQ